MPTAHNPGFPLTRFLCDLITATPERLRAMDIQAVARHYGINPAHVEGYRDMQLSGAGVVQKDLFA